MFGMGLGEILLVAVVAIIFLGPEKLPGAMVDIAKFFRQFKRGINEAKDTLEKEIQIDEMKKEAESYSKMLTDTTEELTRIGDLDIPEDKSSKAESKTDETKKETPKITPKSGEISD